MRLSEIAASVRVVLLCRGSENSGNTIAFAGPVKCHRK